MKRDEWEFTYSAREVLAAAKKKKAHHTERLAWWLKKKAKALSEIRKRGIEVNEGVAAQYATSQAGARVNVNVQLAADLAECSGKMTQHTNKVAEYDGWVQTLTRAGDTELALNVDDFLFFFGGHK